MNKKVYLPQENKKGLTLELVEFLLNENQRLEKSFNEILITSDGYCTMVYFDEKQEYCGFQYVDEDHVVMRRVIFPDNSCTYCFDDDVDEVMSEWYKEHEDY